MKFNLQKIRTIIIISLLLFINGLFTAFFQENIIKVKANSVPIIFSIDHLDFGVVFPSENINSQQFTVHFIEENLHGEINYAIVKKRKPLLGAAVPLSYSGTINEYCQEYPEDLTRCYRNLCPYLTPESSDNEGNDSIYAQIGYGSDVIDNWFVILEVPPIRGFVGQSFTGEPIDSNGIYGCDIELELLII